MHRLSISQAWDESKAIFARDGRLLVAVALALVVLPMILVGLAAPSPESQGGTLPQVLQIVASLIGIIAQVALIRLAIGPTTTVGGAISHGARRFPAALGALLLMVILMLVIVAPVILAAGAAGIVSPRAAAAPTAAGGVVVLLLVVLVFGLAVKFILTVPVASAESTGPIGILKRSWKLSNGHYWRLLALMLLLVLAAVLLILTAGAIGGILAAVISPGLEPFSLGALVLALFTSIAQGAFTILSSLMIARVYVQLAGASDAEVTVPSSNS